MAMWWMSLYLGILKHISPSYIYLMCSDGLSDMISDEDILSILNSAEDTGGIANALADAANDAGGKDNISVIICRT